MKASFTVIFALLQLMFFYTELFSEYAVKSGVGDIKLSGLLQFWYEYDDLRTPKDTFRLRRAEIKLAGKITPTILWSLMVDPAQVMEDKDKGRKSPLQDFLIKFKLPFGFEIDFGQYKPPVNMEALTSSAKLLFVERAMIAKELKWGEERDIGITARHSTEWKGVGFAYAVGVFNGAGPNRFIDDNEALDICSRFTANYKGFHLGSSYYSGRAMVKKEEMEKRFAILEAKYEKEGIPFVFLSEYGFGRDKGKKQKSSYFALGYSILKNVQLAARYDFHDPDVNKDDDLVSQLTFGINYFIHKHNAKIQLNHIVHREPKEDKSIFRFHIQLSY